MSQIQVDPILLREAARQLSEAAAKLRRMGDEVYSAASSAPSYDGQFGQKVQSLAADTQVDVTARAERLEQLALRLEQKANDFEAADVSTQTGLVGLFASFRSWLADLGLAWPVDNSNLLGPVTPSPTPEPNPTPSAALTATLSPSVSVASYWAGMSEGELAGYQQDQGLRNDCAEFSIAAGINLLTGTGVKGGDLAVMADEGALLIPFYGLRLVPNGPTTPWQAANIVNEYAAQEGISIRGTAVKATTDALRSYLEQGDVLPVVTIAWDAGEAPVISLGTNDTPPPASDSLGAHAMLLVTYDSDHIDMAGNAKPWGFVNSWVPGGQLLYWMSEDDLNRTLGHPLLTLSNTVLIENVRLDDTIAAGPSLSFAPAPDPSQSLPQTPTSTPTPGESK